MARLARVVEARFRCPAPPRAQTDSPPSDRYSMQELCQTQCFHDGGAVGERVSADAVCDAAFGSAERARVGGRWSAASGCNQCPITAKSRALWALRAGLRWRGFLITTPHASLGCICRRATNPSDGGRKRGPFGGTSQASDTSVRGNPAGSLLGDRERRHDWPFIGPIPNFAPGALVAW